MTSSFRVLDHLSPSADQSPSQSFLHHHWPALLVAFALAWLGAPAAAQSPVLNDFACRQVAARELAEIGPALTAYARDPQNQAAPGGVDSLGFLLPAILLAVEAREGVSLEALDLRATHIGGVAPQRTCRVIARVQLGYTRNALEPDLDPATATTTLQRQRREAFEAEFTYDVTFAGSGTNLQILETEVGAALLRTLAADARQRNEAAMSPEVREAIAEKNRRQVQRAAELQRQVSEAEQRRRQEEERRDREVRQAEFDARQRQREADRLTEEQRQREIAAEQERQARVLAEEARRRAAAQREREEAQNRLWRLERLRGMLASAEDRLARLEADEPAERRRDEQLRRAVPNDDQSWRTRQREQDIARQRARVEELRAEIARAEGTGQPQSETATASPSQAGADTPGPAGSPPAAPGPGADTTLPAAPPIAAERPAVSFPPPVAAVRPGSRPAERTVARPSTPAQPEAVAPSIAAPGATHLPAGPAGPQLRRAPPADAGRANGPITPPSPARGGRSVASAQTRTITMRLECGPFLFGANRAPAFVDEVRFTVTGDRLRAERRTGARPGSETYEGRILANRAVRITGRGGYDSGPSWRLVYEGLVSRTATSLRGVLIRREANGAERVGRRCSLLGAAL